MPWVASVHVLVVHFPIGLLVTATLIDLVRLWRGRDLVVTRLWGTIGVIGAWVACVTGAWNRHWQLTRGLLTGTPAAIVVNWHVALSVAATFMWTLALILKYRRPSSLTTRWMCGLEVSGLGLLLATAHLGGIVAHG